MQNLRLVLLFCILPVALVTSQPLEDSSSEEEADKRGEFSRILRGGPNTFSRILRGGSTFSRILRANGDSVDSQAAFSRFAKSPKSLSRILRGGPNTFSRILKGGPNTFSRILRAYYQKQQQPSAAQVMAGAEASDEAKRESFSRILRSSLSRIYKRSAEEPEWHFQDQQEGTDDTETMSGEDFERASRDPGFSRILRDPHFSRILRAQEFSRIL